VPPLRSDHYGGGVAFEGLSAQTGGTPQRRSRIWRSSHSSTGAPTVTTGWRSAWRCIGHRGCWRSPDPSLRTRSLTAAMTRSAGNAWHVQPVLSCGRKRLAYDGGMGDAARRANLPSFERPPVIEVAVGVHFLQLPGLSTVALVRLADSWRDRYPTIQEQPVLPPVAPGSQVMFQLQNAPLPQRFWLLSENQSTLVQIQHDRLLLNWRKLGDDDPYPRYGRLREDFSALWSDFARFVASGDYGAFQPSLAEVSFFNRIQAASASAVPEAIAALNPHWSLEGHHATSFQIERAIGNPAGRSGQQNIALGYRSQTGFIQLEITSRIGIDAGSNDSSAILDALDDAHDISVAAFDEITTKSAHTAWGKHDVSAN